MGDLYQETPLRIDTSSGSAWGIVCEPQPSLEMAFSTMGIIVIPGGYQCRTGAHRQNVRLCRHLSAHGMTALRLDLQGLGDATGDMQSFEHLSDQIQQATHVLLQHAPHLRHIVLAGLCDGASAALLHWHQSRDERVKGFILINPWVRSETSLAKTHVKHYYWQRLQDKQFWQKLLQGGVGLQAFKDLIKSLRLAHQNLRLPMSSFQERMAQAWRETTAKILLIISADDLTGQEFLEAIQHDQHWSKCLDAPHVKHVTLAHADHTNSSPEADAAMQQACLTWLNQLAKRLSQRPT